MTPMQKISYEELDLLLTTYQDGSKDAAAQLIKNFNGYFKKFLNVIRNHNYNIGDPTQRNFVTMFIKGEEHRRNAHLFRKSPYIERIHYATAYEIQERFAHLTDDEIMSEMLTIFLEMCQKHNWKAPFQAYIQQFFPKKLARALWNWEVDPAIVSFVRFDESNTDMVYEEDFDSGLEDKPPAFIRSHEHTMYDENWVNGFGCGDIFSELTVYERRIMKLYYEQNTFFKQEMHRDDYADRRERLKMTDDDIADRLGFSRKTISQKRNGAKEKIREVAVGLSLIQG